MTIALITASLAAEAGRTVASQTESGFPLRGSFLMFDRQMSRQQWAKELELMRQVGMDTLYVLSVGRLMSNSAGEMGYSLSPEGLLFPSKWVAPGKSVSEDRLEVILSLADDMGMKVYVGSLQTDADWTTGREFTALRTYNKRVAAEILERYGNHRSLAGWYFPQELWMNWVKYYGRNYYGSALVRDFVKDMKQLDRSKATAATVVFKKDAEGVMPPLTPEDLQTVTADFVEATRIDFLMPQDGIGAKAGTPPIEALSSYFAAMAAGCRAASGKTTLVAIIETFTAKAELSDVRYPPASISRVEQQVKAIRPYVTASVSWIFGHDMSPGATYYPKEAGMLYQQYRELYTDSGTEEIAQAYPSSR